MLFSTDKLSTTFTLADITEATDRDKRTIETVAPVRGADVAAQFQSRSQDFLGTTNLGFTGSEDIGGGNKVFFRLEGDLSMSGELGGGTATTTTTTAVGTGTPTAATYTSTSTTKQSTFNRHAHVGIETKQFGTFSAGRQNDSIKDLEGLGQVYNLSDNLHINTQVGDRYAQIYKYATPTFNGLKATYSYSNGAENTSNETVDGAKTLNSYALSYVWKNYSFGVGKGTVTQVATDGRITVSAPRAELSATISVTR
jgi:predicted porin